MLDIVILPHFFHLKNMLPDNLYKICVRILTFLLVFPISVLLTSSNFTSDFQSRRIIGENACYTRLECKKAYSNTPIVYSKWPPKWAKEQDFWAKLGFREWMITIVKKCKWHKYKPNQKLLSCMLLWKKIIKILWHSFEIFIFKKREKSLFCRHFCKHCFSCSSLIPAKCLYVFTISVAKHSIKRVGCFLISFGNKLQDFLVNRS